MAEQALKWYMRGIVKARVLHAAYVFRSRTLRGSVVVSVMSKKDTVPGGLDASGLRSTAGLSSSRETLLPSPLPSSYQPNPSLTFIYKACFGLE